MFIDPQTFGKCSNRYCKNPDAPATLVKDPFAWEVNEEEDWVWLCEQCHQDRADEV